MLVTYQPVKAFHNTWVVSFSATNTTTTTTAIIITKPNWIIEMHISSHYSMKLPEEEKAKAILLQRGYLVLNSFYRLGSSKQIFQLLFIM